MADPTDGSAESRRTVAQDDIVTRLRDVGLNFGDDYWPLFSDAADEIERLRSLIAEWADAHPDAFSNVDLTGEEWQARMGRFLAAEDALRKKADRG